MRRRLLAFGALGALAVGGLLHVLHSPGVGNAVWAASTATIFVPLCWSVARTLWRRDVGVDAIALVAIASALALGQYLAGAVIALMLAGGNALEEYAAGRAGRELTNLLERVPRIAHRRNGSGIEEVPVEDLRPGDVLVVRAGEVVSVDGVVASSGAVLDESTLTGEPLPVRREVGSNVRSGSANAGGPFDLRATRSAEDSAYAGIVRLVSHAQTERAPFVRAADRYAMVFLPVAVGVAALAWVISGDSLRFLAVMVVATPCPLILAAPIAFVAGVSRAARRGVIVKGATAIERLGEARTVLFDKTGTLTLGLPEVERVVSFDGVRPDELLRLAASVDQVSAHVLAEALVHDAERRGLVLLAPHDVEEGLGEGVEGRVGSTRVAVGSSAWLTGHGYAGAEVAARELDGGLDAGRARILVGVDGVLCGAIVMGDHVREDARELVRALHEIGVGHVAMITGDRAAVANSVGEQLGLDRVYAEQSPEEKLEIVRSLRSQPELGSIVMVGDGVNDAPALALADVGIALGGVGATVSSETADVVILVDRIDRVAEAVAIGRRSLGIARQSILVGLGLSFAAMGFAAVGLLPPVSGALLQEGIDVAVIANALRALR
jgi:heavy metal translocating P-type ATPase